MGKPLKLGFKAIDNWLMHFESNEKIYVVYIYVLVTTSMVSFCYIKGQIEALWQHCPIELSVMTEILYTCTVATKYL